MRYPKLTLLAALVFPSVAAGTPPSPCTIRVPMSDGTELLTDVYRAEDPGPQPVVLLRTPYGRDGYEGRANVFNAAGYTFVVQSVRGTGGSEGTFVPFLHEADDGRETLEWLLEQSWSDGDVALFGDSYSAYSALRIAESRPPAVKALFLASPFHDIERMLYPGGAFHLGLNIPWNMLSLGLFDPALDWDALFASLPVSEMIRTPDGAVHPGWAQAMRFFGGAYPEPDPRLASLGVEAETVAAPVFVLTGWHDFVVGQSVELYERLAAARGAPDGRPPPRLLVGPWYHDQADWGGTVVGGVDFGPGARFGWERKLELAIEWFDRWTGPIEAGSEPSADVRFFLMGPNEWVEAERWPPAEVERREWYLAGGPAAVTTEHGNSLEPETPPGAGADSFVYDPLDPVPTVGGVNVHFFPENVGPLDQRAVETRDDVLTYTSAPLWRDTDVIGAVEALIHLSADAPDTDVTAKLVVVRPDGHARIVQEGIQRVRFRTGRATPTPLTPGEVVPVRVELGPTALRVPAGDRLRLEVSGGSFPKYDRNPNTGANPLTATEFRPVRITIHHGPDTPSHIALPIMRPKQDP